MKPNDPIDAEPTIEGFHGRAWLVPSTGAYTCPSLICCWVIEAVWAHPIWHSYSLALVHLRPSPILPEPLIYLEGATHELTLFALNPDQPRAPMLEGQAPHMLSPCNFAAQLVASCDAEAFMRIERAVEAIAQGSLSPDTDYIEQWISLFGSNMIKR